MKNILVITPYYPYPEANKLIKDTNVVHSLVKNSVRNESIIILYYYQHIGFKSLSALLPIMLKRNYQDCLFKDDNNHDILLMEHPCLIPHRFKTFSYFDNKYAKFINNYLSDREIELDKIIVHFPVLFTSLVSQITAKDKVAIYHSFDINDEYRLKLSRQCASEYTKLGFRSFQIQKIFGSNVGKENFLCMSGVPDALISSENIYREWKKNNQLNLVFVGKMVKNKNIEVILKSLKIIKNVVPFHFTIIGEGKERSNIVATINNYGLDNHVSLIGSLPRKEVFDMLKTMDVFILISLKETLGVAYLEAMAMGNLVIGSKGRGIDGIVSNGEQAFFVDPMDEVSLGKILVEINNMTTEEVYAMKKKIYNFICNLSDTAVSRRYLEF